jgi:ABC-type transport system substrate-binding protein
MKTHLSSFTRLFGIAALAMAMIAAVACSTAGEEVIKEVPVEVQKIVEVEKVVVKEVIKEVPVEVVKEVEVIKEVPKVVTEEKVVVKEVEVEKIVIATPSPVGEVVWRVGADKEPQRGGIVRRAGVGHADNMDPVVSTAGGWHQHTLFEQLVSYDLVDYATGEHTLTPDLATEWEFADLTTLILSLRDGVRFTDGSALNAEVVKWNLDRMATAEKSRWKADLGALESVDVINDGTVQLNLHAPSAPIVNHLKVPIMSKAYFDTVGEEGVATKPVGTGPLKLKLWVPDDRLELERNPDYLRQGADGKPLPYIDGLHLTVYTDPSVALVALQTGHLDMYQPIAPHDLEIARKDPNVEVRTMWWMGAMRPRMLFNSRSGPFSDIRLRQAALYALNHEAQAAAYGEGAVPHYFPDWLPGMLGWDESLPHYSYNPEKARQLVCEVDPSCEVEVRFFFISREPDNSLALVVKAMWDDVGIKTTLEHQERLAWIDTMRGDAYEAAQHKGTPLGFDPDALSRRYEPIGSNWGSYDSPDLQDCMMRGRTELDRGKRHEIYKECQRIIYNDAEIGVGFRLPVELGYRKEVNGFGFSVGDTQDLREMWLERR